MTSVTINDATPPFTGFLSTPVCPVIPGALTCTPTTTPPVCTVGGVCSISWAIGGGALQSNQQGVVVYRVTVQ